MPATIRPYFWDIEIEKLNTRRDYIFIISRVLELGRLDSLRWLFTQYSQQHITQALQTSDNISFQTREMIQAIMNA